VLRLTRLFALSMVVVPVLVVSSTFADEPDAFHFNKRLGRGINLGNALEAPREGEWGMTLEPEYFEAIRKAGFQSVRIPIKWSAHAKTEAPFEVDTKFFERVDWAVEQALSRGLTAVINVHHYDEMDKEPEKNQMRLIALWRQIARRYKDRSDQLFFELLNEPHEKLTDALWSQMVPRLLKVIRETNPHRIVIIGPSQWNDLDHLEKLSLPEADRRIIATFHYYRPFEFTHQGAEWVQGSAKWKGRTWTGSADQLSALRRDFEKAAKWAKDHNRPLFLGEFGAYSAADLDSRARWTAAISHEAERLGISSAYWEFGSGFGAYDRDKHEWRQELLQALTTGKAPN
jgi:endoglucanase